MIHCLAKDDNCCSWLCSNRVIVLDCCWRGSMYLWLCFCARMCMHLSVCLSMSLCRCHWACVCGFDWMPFHFLKWDKCLFFLAWLAFLSIAFGSKTSVFYSLSLLGLCLPSTILVRAHLVYIRYLFCFSPHCNKPKCCTVHLPNTLRNGWDHSGISSLITMATTRLLFLSFFSFSSPSLCKVFIHV